MLPKWCIYIYIKHSFHSKHLLISYILLSLGTTKNVIFFSTGFKKTKIYCDSFGFFFVVVPRYNVFVNIYKERISQAAWVKFISSISQTPIPETIWWWWQQRWWRWLNEQNWFYLVGFPMFVKRCRTWDIIKHFIWLEIWFIIAPKSLGIHGKM